MDGTKTRTRGGNTSSSGRVAPLKPKPALNGPLSMLIKSWHLRPEAPTPGLQADKNLIGNQWDIRSQRAAGRVCPAVELPHPSQTPGLNGPPSGLSNQSWHLRTEGRHQDFRLIRI